MSEIKILHTGDLHIGSSRNGIRNGRSEIINTFFRIINICKTENVDLLLVSGDLFDTPYIDSDTASEIISAMSHIPDTLIAISPGNHDCNCSGSVYRTNTFPENVIIFSTLDDKHEIPDKNLCLFGASFTGNSETNSLLMRPDNLNPDLVNICVLHGDIVASSSESNYNPITAEQISSCGFDYLALGHIHKRTEISKSGNTFFAYCGCPDARGFDEDGSRGVYIGTVGKGKCNLEYKETSSRKYIYDEADISDCDTSLNIATKILAHLKEKYSPDFESNLYRITLKGTLPTSFSPNISQIESTINNTVAYIKITDSTDTDLNDITLIAKENSLRGIFVQKMLQMAENADDDKKDLHYRALRIGLKAFEKGVTLHDN